MLQSGLLKETVAKQDALEVLAPVSVVVWAFDLAPTHLSTLADYSPARSPAELQLLHPTIMVANRLFSLGKVFRFPTDLRRLFPTR